MVTLRCDACDFVCDHTVCGVLFAVAWIASGRTKLAYCRDYGATTNCPGVLRSALTDGEIDSEMKAVGYDRDGTRLTPQD